jgi:hypothetical protein
MADYKLPDLDYGYGALEPHISGQINEIHHSKHHATYVKGVNDAIAKLEDARTDGDHSAILLNEKNLAFHLGGHVATPSGGRTSPPTEATSRRVSSLPRSTSSSGRSISSGHNSPPPPTGCRARAGRCWATTRSADGC